jgi:hypothetical protein
VPRVGVLAAVAGVPEAGMEGAGWPGAAVMGRGRGRVFQRNFSPSGHRFISSGVTARTRSQENRYLSITWGLAT